jgi:hypothetical protein
MNTQTVSTFERYLALDIHKHYVVVAGVNAQQQVILPPRRLDLGEWAQWMPSHLHPTDVVVLEATTNAWQFYDEVAPRVGRAVVVHAGLVKLIASAQVKTDKLDVLHLARLLAANLIPEVWVPPQEVRELRAAIPSPAVDQDADDDAQPSQQRDSPLQPHAPAGRALHTQAPRLVVGVEVVPDRDFADSPRPCHPRSSRT